MPGLTNALLTEGAQIPTDTLLNVVESHLRRVKAVIAPEELGGRFLLMPLGLEWDVQQSHTHVMDRCSHTFVHTVFIHTGYKELWILA